MVMYVCRRTPRLPGWRKARRVTSSGTLRCWCKACVVSRDMDTREHCEQTLHYSAHPQIQIKNFKYTVTMGAKPKPPPKPVKVTVKPSFKEMAKGGFKDNEVCMRADLASSEQNYHLLSPFTRCPFRMNDSRLVTIMRR